MPKHNKWASLAAMQQAQNDKTTSSGPFEAATKAVKGIAALKKVEQQLKSTVGLNKNN